MNRDYATYFRDYANNVCTKTFKIPNNKFALRLYGSYKAIGTLQKNRPEVKPEVISFCRNFLQNFANVIEKGNDPVKISSKDLLYILIAISGHMIMLEYFFIDLLKLSCVGCSVKSNFSRRFLFFFSQK